MQQLQNYLRTERRYYSSGDIDSHISKKQRRLMPAARAFATLKSEFDNALTKSASFELMQDRSAIMRTETKTILQRLRDLVKLTGMSGNGQIAKQIKHSIARARDSEVWVSVPRIGRELTRIHRLFIESGIAIGDHDNSIGPIISDPKSLGSILVYPYVRWFDGDGGSMGEYYPRNQEVNDLILLDVSRTIGFVTFVVHGIGDGHLRSQDMRSVDFDRQMLREAEKNPELARDLYHGIVGVLGGKFLYQAIMEQRHVDPEQWFLKVVNAHLQAVAVHERVHQFLDQFDLPETVNEAYAMLGQVVYAGSAGLSFIFSYNTSLGNPHSIAARTVVDSLLRANGIQLDKPQTFLMAFDLTVRDFETHAGAILDYECMMAAGRIFTGLASESEMIRTTTTKYVEESQLPLFYALKHSRG